MKTSIKIPLAVIMAAAYFIVGMLIINGDIYFKESLRVYAVMISGLVSGYFTAYAIYYSAIPKGWK